VESVCVPGLGEPTLHPQLAQMILAVKQARLPLHIATNLTTKSPAQLKALLLCDIIDVTLLAPHRSGYEELQAPGHPELFDVVMDNFRYLLRNRKNKQQRINIAFIATKLNTHFLKDMLKLATRLNLNEVKIQAFDSVAANKHIALDEKGMAGLFHNAERYERSWPRMERKYLKDYYDMKLSGIRPAGCYMGYFTMLVGINGSVRVGCFSPESPIAGNCKRQSIGNIWLSPRAQAVRYGYHRQFEKFHRKDTCCPFLVRNKKLETFLSRQN
jgi:MoaA/NifB/PqqE/SkfB family radical SAM enzyme